MPQEASKPSCRSNATLQQRRNGHSGPARVRLGIVERSGVGRAGEELGDGAFEGARAEPVDDANLSDAGTLRAIEEGFEAIEGLSDAQANHVQLDRYLLLRLWAAA